MCNNTEFPTWEAESIKSILELEFVELRLLIINDQNKESASIAFIKKIRQVFSNKLFWAIYNKIIDGVPDALKQINLSKQLTGVERINCKIIKKGKFSQYFSSDSISQIKLYNLDFILRFGFDIIKGEILDVPKYGIWSFHHGNNEKYRGMPSCFWEIYNNDDITGAILQRITNTLDNGVVLKKGFFRTNKLSLKANRELVYTSSSIWASSVCLDIINNKADYFNHKPKKTSARLYKIPNNKQMIYFFYTLLKNLLKKIIYRFFISQYWFIGTIDGKISELFHKSNYHDITWINNIGNNQFADPFIIESKGKSVILCEQIDNNDKGVISYLLLNDDGIKIGVSIDKIHHLSFPYIFFHNGSIYCMPEQYEKNEISIFKAIDFPLKWKKVHTILSNITAVDPAIIYYNDRWWLFFTLQGDDSNLFIYHSDDLFGQYIVHLCNPVKNDPRSSRSAGNIYIHKDDLYRPAQTCVKYAGEGIVINKILDLTTESFSEEIISTISTNNIDSNIDGVHTISHCNEKIAIDAMIFNYRFSWIKNLNAI